MSIINSLFSGVSGLSANGKAISVIGNNIANVNTIGYKSGSVTFADVLSESAGEAGQVGRGTYLSSITPSFTQGSFQGTSNVLDLGIDGNGFFIVSDTTGIFYSRAGRFEVDDEGYIVNPEGLKVQGYSADNTGTLTGAIGDLNIGATQSYPNATTAIEITANVDSRETIPAAFDVDDPTNTSNFSTTLSVYDSLGNGHPISVYFRKSAESATGNTWEYFAVVSDSDNANGTGAEVQAEGTLDFDENGALVTESAVTFATGGFDFVGGAGADQQITFDFGESTDEGGTGLSGSTQFGSASSVVFQSQDGYSAGALQSISVNQDGIVSGLFTNGQSRVLGQIALSAFTSPTNLTKMGKNLYAESFESGQPIVGAPNSSGRGRVLSNSLELSNVDLAEEFINLITAQRAFQANSRIITTTDDMLAELVTLKR